ncbi:hypothetical protein VNO77_44102 [Canavalia gladiata]|uniref:Glycoside hydrolase family 5 domain-containing protein n=1 Tax=Canavalia gladiata TaxID=3824 RepID=A0AAN9JXF8_CANGL
MGRCSSSFPLIPLVKVIVTVVLLDVTLQTVRGFPLHTSDRWIVDERGNRVKLACVNWVSHLDAVVAEGLNHQPLDAISKRIKSMGFNCVRLTWPIFLATDDRLSSLTVRQSFQNLGLNQTIAGIQANNPSIIHLSLINTFKAVVKNLGDNGVMVILDNHLTKPGWCCGNEDGNGFFGDEFFDPEQWITGLTNMATLFKGVTNVIAMSLRNELRGPKQNVHLWFNNMPRGAEAVHTANPDVLVIMSGLNFDTDLSFLRNQTVKLSFGGKLVLEVHHYGFTDGQAWVSGNPNKVCGKFTGNIFTNAAFLLDQKFPLLVSEFGGDLRGTNENDNRYLNCFIAIIAELDLDWALWSLVGSYYIRQGLAGTEEVYGVVNANWTQPRNPSFSQRITGIQPPFRGPGFPEATPHKVIFHSLTGLCILRPRREAEPLKLGVCSNSNGWEYTIEHFLSTRGTPLCLQAEGEGKVVKVGNKCSDQNGKWEIISDSKMHISTKVNNGSDLCLDVDANNIILTNPCKCLNQDNKCDPVSQWFKLVDTTRKIEH